MIRLGSARRIRHDKSGVTVVEFGMVAPVLALVLLGAFDVAHTLYMRGTLQGILQKAARDAALESGSTTAQQALIDAKVTAQVTALANNADINFSRRYYRSFTDAARARHEEFTDTNNNGVCDQSEPYVDANHNNTWDRDGADDGQGGAKDSTVYTVTVSYPRFFPIYNLIGGSNTTRLEATTVLRNQPYSDQGSYVGTPQTRQCPAALLAPPGSAPAPTPSPAPSPSPSPTPPAGGGGPSCTINLLGICVL